MTDLRFRPAYISVAVSRSTEPRRVVELYERDHHHGRRKLHRASVKTRRRIQEALAGFLNHGAGDH